MDKSSRYYLSLLALVFLFCACEKINQFYDEPSNEELVALANQKYEAITTDTNFFNNHTVFERVVLFDKELHEIKNLDPDNKKVMQSLSRSYLRKGLLKEWKYYADRQLFMDPASNQGSRGYTLLYKLKAYRKALNDFYGVKAAHKGPYYISQLNIDFLIATCHMQLQEHEKALEYLEKYRKHETLALGESYLSDTYYLYRARVFLNMGNEEKAISELDYGIKRSPEFTDYYFMKADIAMKNEQYEKALALNDQAAIHYEKTKYNYRFVRYKIEDIYYEDLQHQRKTILRKAALKG